MTKKKATEVDQKLVPEIVFQCYVISLLNLITLVSFKSIKLIIYFVVSVLKDMFLLSFEFLY